MFSRVPNNNLPLRSWLKFQLHRLSWGQGYLPGTWELLLCVRKNLTQELLTAQTPYLLFLHYLLAFVLFFLLIIRAFLGLHSNLVHVSYMLLWAFLTSQTWHVCFLLTFGFWWGFLWVGWLFVFRPWRLLEFKMNLLSHSLCWRIYHGDVLSKPLGRF